MAWRVIRDYVRRRWWIYAIPVPQLLLMTIGESPGGASVMPIVPVLMGAAAVLGPGFAGGYLPTRELRLLPLTRHQRWLAYWGLSMVAAVVVSATASVAILLPVLFGRAIWPAIEMAVLVSLWTCGFVGTTVALVSFARATRADERGLARLVTTATRVCCVTLVMGGIVLVILWREYLATEWAAMTPGATLALSGMLLLTAAGAVRAPGPFAGLDAMGGHSGAVVWPSWLRLRDRLTGLPKLVWRDWISALARCGAVVLATEALLVSVQWAMPSERDTPSFAQGWFGAEFIPGFQFFYVAFMLVSMPDGHGGFFRVNLVRASVRHLRTLPIDPWKIAILVLLRRVAGWIALWLTFLLVYVVTVGPPDALRFEWVLCIAGVDALVDAGRLRYRYGLAAMIVGYLFIGIPLAVLAKAFIAPRSFAEPFALLVGLAALAVALVSHYRCITGERDVYLPEPETQWPVKTAALR
jgi:hypothetical protein